MRRRNRYRFLADLASEAQNELDPHNWRDEASREGPFSRGRAYAEYRTSNRLDNVLGLPLLLWGLQIFEPRDGFWIWAYAAWALAIVIWVPWLLWRVVARNPPGDVWRAGAVLALVFPPWLIPFLLMFVIPDQAPMAAFPLVYGLGGAMMLMALRRSPPSQTQGRRTFMLGLGGAIYALVAVLLLLPAAFGLTGGRTAIERAGNVGLFFGGLATILGILAAALGLRLLVEAKRAWRSGGGDPNAPDLTARG